MSEELLFKYIALVLGSSGLTVMVIVLYLFSKPDKFEHWMRIFYQFVYYITANLPNIKKSIDKKLVAVSIQDTVNQICDQVNEECPESLPHAMKIEWVKSDNPASFVAKGKAIIRLKHYENQDRNIVKSTLLYLKQGFLPRAKNYLDNTLRQGSEYKVASRIFVARRDTGAYDYFLQNEMMPAVKADVRMQEDLQILEGLDSVGFFSRVFLSEVIGVGQKLLGTVPTDSVKRELRDFAKFLDTIAIKAKEEHVTLSFNGTKVKASVILVAKHETIANYGIRPYVSRIQKCLNEGYDSIYLAGWGEDFIGAVIQIKKEIEELMLTFIRRYDYPVHGTTKAILMVCQPKSSYLAQQKRLHDEVREAFPNIVPEVEKGLIGIMSVARIENVGFKVAVKALDPELRNPCGCCIGTGAERIKKLKERFPSEFIGVTLWSDDIKEFIANAISPLNSRYIDDIQIDEENLIANVIVLTRESANKAIGRGGHNVRLASELTGYLINVQSLPLLHNDKTPEGELTAILKREIPEILNSDIEIVAVSRIRNVGSKVIVKWKDIESNIVNRSSEACYGYDQQYLRRIKEYFPGEWIHFHDWDQKPEEQIRLCLYPIRSYEIESVEIDDSSGLAVVTLNQIPKNTILSESAPNIALCEEVTGYKIEIIHP